jgi:glycerophosphoryl diester phosphodiesterase
MAERAFAHRGLHDASRPENSKAAFSAAIDAGYGIELDVQPSADAQAMVFHDSNLKRLTGLDAAIAAKPAADLQRLSLAGTGETMPTLADVLALIGGRVPLLIELKNESATAGVIEPAVARVLADYPGPAAVMSWNVPSMAWFRRFHPNLPRGLVVTGFWGGLSFSYNPLLLVAAMPVLARRAGAQFLAHDVRCLPSRRSIRFRAAGKPVVTWTVRTEAQLETAREYADAPVFEGDIERLLRAPAAPL